MRTKLILETGCNHQGDLKIAMDMIKEAAKLGASAIKFQKRDVELFSNELKNKPRSLENSFGTNYYEHRKALEFTKDQLKELMKFTKSKDLTFICSAFDEQSVLDLVDIGCRYIKLPSQLYTDDDLKKLLIELRLNKDINIIVSTGMHSEEEIFNNSWIKKADIVMHCISVYPAKLSEMNLNTLKKLNKEVNGMVGYSSHENEGYGIIYSVLCGAECVERHFTLNREWKGSDHGTVSSDIGEVKKIISDIEMAERMLGEQDRPITIKEKKVRKIYRGF